MQKGLPLALVVLGLYALLRVGAACLVPPGGPSNHLEAVASSMGVAVYPGARSAGGGYSACGVTSRGVTRSSIDGHIGFVVGASPRRVARFYQRTYAAAASIDRVSLLPPQELVVWQDAQAGYAVLVGGRGAFPPVTRFELLRSALRIEAVGPPAPGPGVPPAALGLTVCPGATVDYSGWLPGRNGRIATARLQVRGSSRKAAEYYRRLAAGHPSRGQGNSSSGSVTVQANVGWDVGDDCYSVAMLCPSWSFPAIVWLQRAENESEAAVRQREAFARRQALWHTQLAVPCPPQPWR